MLSNKTSPLYTYINKNVTIKYHTIYLQLKDAFDKLIMCHKQF